VIEALLRAGAEIEDGILSWITQQPAPSLIKQRIAEVLQPPDLKSWTRGGKRKGTNVNQLKP
jgi:hypothetical protein